MSTDLARIKQGARWLWSQGDYTDIAQMLEPEAQALARRCVRAGDRVLDVAAGNGNFALEAARLGATVTASDLSPRMLELGQASAAAEGLELTWLEADAESLPFPDSSYDVVASVFGAMFAPQPDLVAAEMFRVVRHGGVVAMANYGVEGYLWRLSALIASFSTTPAPELPSPFLWGDAEVVRTRMGGLATRLELEPLTLTMRFRSLADWRERFAQPNPTLAGLKALLPAPAYESLIAQAAGLAEAMNAGSVEELVLNSSYLVVKATR